MAVCQSWTMATVEKGALKQMWLCWRDFDIRAYLNEISMDNQRVLQTLDDLFNTAGISVRSLNVIGFACGPGSFTGVRMAAAVVQVEETSADMHEAPNKKLYLLASERKSPFSN